MDVDVWKRMARNSISRAGRSAAAVGHLEATLVLVDGHEMATKVVLP